VFLLAGRKGRELTMDALLAMAMPMEEGRATSRGGEVSYLRAQKIQIGGEVGMGSLGRPWLEVSVAGSYHWKKSFTPRSTASSGGAWARERPVELRFDQRQLTPSLMVAFGTGLNRNRYIFSPDRFLPVKDYFFFYSRAIWSIQIMSHVESGYLLLPSPFDRLNRKEKMGRWYYEGEYYVYSDLKKLHLFL
jgi:hypothetical protein